MKKTCFLPILLWVLLLGTFQSCSPNLFVKNIPEKTHVLTGSFGGPLAKVPGIGAIPLPLTSLGYGYGLRKNTSVYGSIHTTSFAFGLGHLQLGCTQKVWKNSEKRMGITISPSIHLMLDRWEKNVRAYPEISSNWYWDFSKIELERSFRINSLYAGIGTWIELNSEKAHGQSVEKRVMLQLNYGHIFERKKFDYSVELKFIAPFRSNKDIVVSYLSPSKNTGALGLYFGLKYKL